VSFCVLVRILRESNRQIAIIETKEMDRMKKNESVSNRAEVLCWKIVEAEKELYTLREIQQEIIQMVAIIIFA